MHLDDQERARPRRTYTTRDQARLAIFDYIECFYNPLRRHSASRCSAPTTTKLDTGRTTPRQPPHNHVTARPGCGAAAVAPAVSNQAPVVVSLGTQWANCGNRWMRPRRRDEPRASRETRVGRRPDAVHRPTQLVARLSAVQFDGEGDKAASRDAAKQVSARFATTDEHDEQLLARRCWEATLPVHPQLGPSVGTGLGLRRD